MPIKRNDERIDYSTLDMTSMQVFDGFFSYHSRPIFYKTIQTIDSSYGPYRDDADKKKSVIRESIILYFDQKMRNKEILDAKSQKEGSIDSLKNKRFPSMGTITLASTIIENKTPKEIYETD